MKERDTPLKLVRLWPKLLPGCYEQLDHLAGAKTDGEIWWPDYCALPISAAFTLLRGQEGMDDQMSARSAAELTACWTWRQNKIVYSFDPDLASALAAQVEDLTDTDVLPVDLLLHLPYRIIYVKAPGLMEHSDGFFTWIEWDVNRKAPELRVQLVLDDMCHSIPMVLHLIPGGTIQDCVDDTIRTTQEVNPHPMPVAPAKETASFILTAVQLILYLVSVNADVEDEPLPVKSVRTGPKTVNLIRDKAGEVSAKQVGIRVGSALRRATSHSRHEGNASTVAGSHKRPHTRRGHWHHYWTGPRDGNRELVLKWTAPTFIHPEDGQEDTVVLFPVK